MRIQATLSFALMATLSCGGSPTPAPTPPVSDQPGTESQVTDMHLHFEDINSIQLALISGNLVLARSLAKQVRASFAGAAPEGWAPFVERSVASAEMLEVTDDLNMAARLAGAMAGTCGDCHRDQGVVVVDHEAVAPPVVEDKFQNFMVQHRWAADRMWEVIIGPNDAAWNAGAAALEATELTAEDIGKQLIVTPEIEGWLAQVRKDGAAAKTTQGAQERQELYGSFLAGCASCHSEMMNQRD
jgi:cytochrome c553